ncbi:MAG TPA: hypothetical protein VF491_13620 [Vicinamibacterales bacterium]|jgi:hypothetical protein
MSEPKARAQHQLGERFRKHLQANITVALIILIVSLAIGMIGYHTVVPELSWIDAFVNSSMLLSGMGPLGTLPNDEAKLFAGIYALYCGVVFIATVGLVLAPVGAHVLRRFHLDKDR